MSKRSISESLNHYSEELGIAIKITREYTIDERKDTTGRSIMKLPSHEQLVMETENPPEEYISVDTITIAVTSQGDGAVSKLVLTGEQTIQLMKLLHKFELEQVHLIYTSRNRKLY